ncbi:MAG: hypothetical protein Q4G68_14490 [Planctomycetia bacterium]|nr:hypothetical protein [Planctomycetia bacterium]
MKCRFMDGEAKSRYYAGRCFSLALLVAAVAFATGGVQAQDVSIPMGNGNVKFAVVPESSSLQWKAPTEEPADVPEAETAQGTSVGNPAIARLIKSKSTPATTSQVRLVEYSALAAPEESLGAYAAAPNAVEPGQVLPVEEQKTTVTPGTSPFLDGREGYIDVCPDPKSLPSIRELSYKVVPQPGLFPEGCPLPEEVYSRKAPTPITFTWKASCLCYKPLYFEDVQLERYGHTANPLLQPVISRARFWLTIPVLPYLMGVNPPNECIYDLGYYRPGSCAPHMLNPVPVSLRAGLIQAGATVGFVYLIP